MSVLEIGCGTGAVLRDVGRAFPGATLLGIDLDPALIAYAKGIDGPPNVRYAIGDLTTGIDWQYDFVYSIDVVHHLPVPLDGFRAVRRALSDTGAWLLIEPNLWHPYVAWLQESMKRAGLGEDHFRPWRLIPEMRAAGLRVVEHNFVHLWPGTVTDPSRLMQRVERSLEKVPFLGGSTVYLLAAR
jgi:SAM-dependent methyltransferase